MAEPSEKYDVCRTCGEEVKWQALKDPLQPPNPGPQPVGIMNADLTLEWKEKQRAYFDWERRKPTWHARAIWWHTPDGGAPYLNCVRDGEKLDEGHYRATVAEALNFCNERIQAGNSYSRFANICNRPVTYEPKGVCGVHAKPHIERARAQELRAQQEAEQAALRDSVQVVVDHLTSLGIKSELHSVRYNSLSGKLLLPMESVMALLERSDSFDTPESTVPELEVAEGFNPFLENETDDDEEEWEEF